MLNFRIRRALVLDRRERAARCEQLRRDLRTWAWWSDFLSWRVLPVFLLLFLGWSFGFVNGATYIAKEIDAQFVCEVKHAD